MKLKNRKEARDPVEVRSRFEADDFDELEDYARLYQETYGKEIAPKELVTDIVTQFMRTDRGFRRWKKQQQGVSGANGSGRANGHADEANIEGEEARV